MTFKTVVIDDEARALSLMVDYITKVPSLELVKSFQNSIEALEYLNNHTIDILFIDIQMPDITGLELLASLQTKPLVIFSTGYPQYAVDGFQLDAIDYLVKPIMFPRFLKAVNKATNQAKLLQKTKPPTAELHSEGTAALPPSESGYIFVKVDTRWERIELSDITFIESYGDYISINRKNSKKTLCLQTLTQMLTRLDGNNFVRVHRSYIVNLQRVEIIEKDHLLIDGQDISIGKSYRLGFLTLIGSKG